MKSDDHISKNKIKINKAINQSISQSLKYIVLLEIA